MLGRTEKCEVHNVTLDRGVGEELDPVSVLG